MKKFFLILIFIGAGFPVRGQAPPPAEEAPGLLLNFQNTEIDSVLRFLGQATGRVFIKSDAVRGFISVISSKRVSSQEALSIFQTALELKGFTLIEGPGNMVKVLTRAEAVQSDSDVRVGVSAPALEENGGLVTQVVPLNFIAAGELKPQLTPLLSKGGSLISDDRGNSLILTDQASNVRRLLKVIEALDARTPQVLIEALIVEVSLTNETKLGFEWSYAKQGTRGGRTYDQDIDQSFDLNSFLAEGLRYSVIREGGGLRGLVQALATEQNINILSSPHILTINNKPAVIRVGEEVPVLTQTRVIQGGESIQSFDYKSVAIELTVTPRINHERDVYLDVHPLVKKILGFNLDLNAPILATREAQTSVLLRDGQTVVIGGLMKDDAASNESKIPILGDIPILGAFFRKQSKTIEKTELLVFITPRVVLSPEDAEKITIEKESESKSRNTPYQKSAWENYQEAKRFYREDQFDMALAKIDEAKRKTADKKLLKKLNRLEKKSIKKFQKGKQN